MKNHMKISMSYYATQENKEFFQPIITRKAESYISLNRIYSINYGNF